MNGKEDISFKDAVKILSERKTWEDYFLRTPCVKPSYLWGIGCGSVVFAHKMRLYRGRLGHAINAGVLAFMVVSSASFAMCATDLNRKYELIRQAMSIKGIKPAEERKSPDSP
mmetsp:Transcript_38677/g.77028  ORF Transcript_38677/g.77028 Transcript_38677/m.77028 type:complete len:113 (+) Transcript_38677:32-370(+)